MTSGMMIGRGNGRDQFRAGNGTGSSRKPYATTVDIFSPPDGVEGMREPAIAHQAPPA